MNQLSKIVDSLRFPLIILVVFIHCSGHYSYTMSDIEWNDFGSTELFVLFRYIVIDIICRIAVPCFFIFSGYYFFYNIKKFDFSVYKQKIKKRVKSLLIPYLLWNMIQFLISACLVIKSTWNSGVFHTLTKLYNDFGGILGIFWNGNVSTTNINFLGLVDGRTAPADMPLWFLRDLIAVSLLSPIIYKIIKIMGGYWVMVLLLVNILHLWPWIPGLSIDALCYFSLGTYLSVEQIDIIKYVQKYQKFIVIIVIILFPILIINHKQAPFTLHPLFIISTIALMISLLSSSSKNTQRLKDDLCKLKPTVFFIYAIHFTPIVAFLPPLFERYYTLDNLFLNILLSFSIPLSCVLLSLIFYRMTQVISARALNFLIGK